MSSGSVTAGGPGWSLMALRDPRGIRNRTVGCGTSPATRFPISESDFGMDVATEVTLPGIRFRKGGRRRPSPPVDAALERLLHLVEVHREGAGGQVLPAAVGQQGDD